MLLSLTLAAAFQVFSLGADRVQKESILCRDFGFIMNLARTRGDGSSDVSPVQRETLVTALLDGTCRLVEPGTWIVVTEPLLDGMVVELAVEGEDDSRWYGFPVHLFEDCERWPCTE